MTKIIFDISMSLDGYINAQNPRLEAGLGAGGDADRPRLLAFLQQHAARMPRAMLRAAIEKLPKAHRARYLGMGKK